MIIWELKTWTVAGSNPTNCSSRQWVRPHYKTPGHPRVETKVEAKSWKSKGRSGKKNIENFHEWKIILLQYINFLVKTLNFTVTLTSYFPSFCKGILKLWSKYDSNQPSLHSTIISQYLWFNSFIKIDNKVVFQRKFLKNNIC